MHLKSIKAIYVSSYKSGSGSMIISLGLIELLKRHYSRIALFRPFVFDRDDKDMQTLLKYFKVEQSLKSTQGLTLKKVEKILANDGLESLIEQILERYEKLSKDADFVLCLGSRLDELNQSFGEDLNIELAKNLSAPIAGVISTNKKDIEYVKESITLWSKKIYKAGAEIFTIGLNHWQLNSKVCQNLSKAYDFPIFCIPRVKELERLTLLDALEHLDLDYLAGDEKQKENEWESVRFASMGVELLLESLEPYELFISSSSRIDIALAMLISAQSHHTPPSTALILCGREPSQTFNKLIENLKDIAIPILYTPESEESIFLKLLELKPSFRVENRRKIDRALGVFFNSINSLNLQKRLKMSQDILTPSMFRIMLFERAKRDIKKILLPEIEDDRILIASEYLLKREIVKIVFVGSAKELYLRSKKLGLELSQAQILEPNDDELSLKLAKRYYEIRKDKGLSLDVALDRVNTNKTLFATLALEEGIADGLVSGAIHSTRDTVLPALQIIKTAKDYPISSSCFFMCLPTKVLIYADCAINPKPTANELATIALESVESALKFDIPPRVAMLSYSTGDSGKGADVDKVRRATEIIKEKYPDLPIAGPIQYDAAIDPEVAKIKMPNNPTAGHATIFIFPDLETGNIAYKAVQRSSKAVAIGPIMQGLKKPVNDLSRGCSIDDIIDTVALTAIQAQEQE